MITTHSNVDPSSSDPGPPFAPDANHRGDEATPLGGKSPVDTAPSAIIEPNNAGHAANDLDLPPEVSLSDAARIANCDKKTIIRYLKDGVLEWRDIAPPSSSRPTYRIKLASLLALRTSYRSGHPSRRDGMESGPAPESRRRTTLTRSKHAVTSEIQFKHIRFGPR
jgi:hypothetical protein